MRHSYLHNALMDLLRSFCICYLCLLCTFSASIMSVAALFAESRLVAHLGDIPLPEMSLYLLRFSTD